MRKILLAVLILAGLSESAWSQKIVKRKAQRNATPLFWQITRVGSADTSYLFGTLHLLEKSYVDTMGRLMSALHSTDATVGEIVLDSSLQGDLLTSTQMKGSLLKLIPKKYHKTLGDEVERVIGLPLTFLDNFKPVVVYAMLVEGLYQKAHPENHKSGIPMDIFFQRDAKKRGKPMLGLESTNDQSSLLFDSLPLKSQVTSLVALLSHEQKAMSEMDTMLAEYHRGYVSDVVAGDVMEGFSKKETEDFLFSRNARWLRELPDILNAQRTFIAVGAAHLIGTKGLVAGLRKLGYRVEPLDPHSGN